MIKDILLISNKFLKTNVFISKSANFDYSVHGLPLDLVNNYYGLYRYQEVYDEKKIYNELMIVSSKLDDGEHNVFPSSYYYFIGLTGTEEELFYFSLKYAHESNKMVKFDTIYGIVG